MGPKGPSVCRSGLDPGSGCGAGSGIRNPVGAPCRSRSPLPARQAIFAARDAAGLLPQPSGRSVAGSARIAVSEKGRPGISGAVGGETGIAFAQPVIPALIPLAGLTALLGLPGTMPGMIDDFQQMSEGPGVPVLVRAFRYIVKLVEAVKCAGAVQLAIGTGPGS